MIASIEPTRSARSTVWMRSNSAATSPSLSERAAVLASASATRSRARSSPSALSRRGLELGHPRIGVGPGVDVAGEHGRGRRRTADDRRVGALDGDDLHVVVERPGEDHEGSSVVAGDDAEDDRAVEVDDRAADLGAVLELELAQRLRRAVEAREVGQHDQRAGCRWRR